MIPRFSIDKNLFSFEIIKLSTSLWTLIYFHIEVFLGRKSDKYLLAYEFTCNAVDFTDKGDGRAPRCTWLLLLVVVKPFPEAP